MEFTVAQQFFKPTSIPTAKQQDQNPNTIKSRDIEISDEEDDVTTIKEVEATIEIENETEIVVDAATV